MTSNRHHPTLLLASASRYRRELLQRLTVDFRYEAADIDEAPAPGESARELVMRLAEAKARTVATRQTGDVRPLLVIGSDQVAVRDRAIIGKPGNYNNAVNQLRRASGKELTFLTGLCVLDTGRGVADVGCVPCHVRFRELDDALIHAYLDREPAFDCAGAFRSEGLGIALLEEMQTEDPTALIGLPLISLTRMLSRAGYDVISAPQTDINTSL